MYHLHTPSVFNMKNWVPNRITEINVFTCHSIELPLLSTKLLAPLVKWIGLHIWQPNNIFVSLILIPHDK